MKWCVYPEGEELPIELQELAMKVEEDGGKVLSIYREPYRQNWQLFVILPLSKVEPTPFQRDLSPQHVKRLGEVIQQMGRYIDPIVVVRTREGKYWTPNGNHRRSALSESGGREIPAILVPDESVAYQILMLNTEKAHNIKEKSLEVIRMYRDILLREPQAKEKDYAFEFEAAFYITLGILYDGYAKFSGSAYASVLKRVDDFLDAPLEKAMEERERRANLLKELDSVVEEKVEQLRSQGVNHPFLKQAVVSSANPIKRKRTVDMDFDTFIKRMRESLEGVTFEGVMSQLSEPDVEL